MATEPMTEEQLLARPWWKEQNKWAQILGLLAVVLAVVPGAQIPAAVAGVIAAELGYKGLVDKATRTEKIAAANAAKLEKPC